MPQTPSAARRRLAVAAPVLRARTATGRRPDLREVSAVRNRWTASREVTRPPGAFRVSRTTPSTPRAAQRQTVLCAIFLPRTLPGTMSATAFSGISFSVREITRYPLQRTTCVRKKYARQFDGLKHYAPLCRTIQLLALIAGFHRCRLAILGGLLVWPEYLHPGTTA